MRSIPLLVNFCTILFEKVLIINPKKRVFCLKSVVKWLPSRVGIVSAEIPVRVSSQAISTGEFLCKHDLGSALKNTILASTLGLSVSLAHAADTIKVGVLHSLSGTMAISETTLKDTVLMMVEQQNAKGGLLGKKLEAVVVDPASNWPLFAGEDAGAFRERESRCDFGAGYL